MYIYVFRFIQQRQRVGQSAAEAQMTHDECIVSH